VVSLLNKLELANKDEPENKEELARVLLKEEPNNEPPENSFELVKAFFSPFWKRGFFFAFSPFLGFSSFSETSEASLSLSLSDKSPNNPRSLLSFDPKRVFLNNFEGSDFD
jgi:hypothetical protein